MDVGYRRVSKFSRFFCACLRILEESPGAFLGIHSGFNIRQLRRGARLSLCDRESIMSAFLNLNI